MSIEARFIIFQALVIGPFLAGMVARPFIADREAWYRRIIGVNLALLEPPVILWSIWGLSLSRPVAVLPIAGLALVVAGFALGRVLSPAVTITAREARTFTISASLANHGFTMGGFLCYVLLGETGLGLAAVFIVYFMPWVFLIMFPYAGGTMRELMRPRNLVSFFMTTRNMPLAASLIALALNLAGIPRPTGDVPIGALAAVPMSLYYFVLGLTVTPSPSRTYGRAHAALALEKFVLLPALAALAVAVLGLTPPLSSVIMVQSCMPAAIYSVVAVVLHDLDVPLASSLFLVNTVLFIVLVLPLLFGAHALGFL